MCAWHRPHSEQWRESCTNEIFTWFKLCRRLPCLTCLYSQQDQLWTFNPLFSVVSPQMWLLLLFLWLQDRKVIWIPTLKNCPSFNATATFASRLVLLLLVAADLFAGNGTLTARLDDEFVLEVISDRVAGCTTLCCHSSVMMVGNFKLPESGVIGHPALHFCVL